MFAEWGEAMTHLSTDCRQTKQLRNCWGPFPRAVPVKGPVRIEKNQNKIGEENQYTSY